MTSRKRIFVVGTGRSGTCWMGNLLGSHSRVCGFIEPRPVFDLVTRAAIHANSDGFLWEQIIRAYDVLFETASPHHLADKTHPLLWMAERVASHYDQARFIAMLRDVKPTVASMLRHQGVRRWCEQWDRYPIPNKFLGITAENVDWYRAASLVQRCTARWHAHRHEVIRLTPLLGDQLLTVTYERLATDPSSTLAQVQDFLEFTEPFPDASPNEESLLKWQIQLTAQETADIDEALAHLTKTQ